jgi:hypothetical protein
MVHGMGAGDASKCPFMNSKDEKKSSWKSSISNFVSWVLVILVAYVLTSRDYNMRDKSYTDATNVKRVFKNEELGLHKSQILLAIVGEVFDVSSGAKYYGSDGSYGMLAGKDASRAYGTGELDVDGLVDYISDLKPKECAAIKSYYDFYATHKTYRHVGVLEGRFYDNKGQKTEEKLAYEQCAAEGEELNQRGSDTHEKCQFNYTHDTGEKRVMCSDNFVPRRLNFQTTTGSEEVCVCMRPNEAMVRGDAMIFKGCGAEDTRCTIKQ